MEVVTAKGRIMGNAHPGGLFLGIWGGRMCILGEVKSVSWFWELPMNLFKNGRFLEHFYDNYPA